MFQVVSTSGSIKGTAFSLESGELQIGRHAKCDVILPDPMVSRNHCRLYLDGEDLVIEDLGSRTPVLVNGVPAQRQQLRIGDELAVSGYRFLVGSTPKNASGEPAECDVPGQDTWTWNQAKPVSIDVNTVHLPRQIRPKTIEDLIALYEAAHEFARASTTAELVDVLCQILDQRLNPERFWVALVSTASEIVPYVFDHVRRGEWQMAPTSAMQQAVDQGQALLIPGSKTHKGTRVVITTLVIPVVAGGAVTAVMAMQTVTPRSVFDERDLEFAALLARQLAPALSAVEMYEQLTRDNERLRLRAGESRELIGKSHAMVEVRRQIDLAAKPDLCVIIEGETGVGKDLVARLLHLRSNRSGGPFVVVNCAAIPRDLFESEVFGYEKGAFTGATERHDGFLSQANGGTLFLDEVGDLSVENQARILRCVEDGSFRPLGGKKERRVDVRFIAATNRSLSAAVAEGRFRKDLYHRLAGFEIRIPPLRERKSDLGALAQFFFDQGRLQAKRPLTGFAPKTLDVLTAYSWPGNVRELRQCVQRAIATAQSTLIQPDDLGLHHAVETGAAAPERILSLAEAEKQHLANALRHCQGDVTFAAKLLGLSRSTLYRKLAAYNLKAQ